VNPIGSSAVQERPLSARPRRCLGHRRRTLATHTRHQIRGLKETRYRCRMHQCARSLDQRSERRRSGGGAAEARGRHGVPRSGEPGQARPGAASPFARNQLDAGDSRDGDAARPTSGPPPRHVEHVRGDHRQGARFLSGNTSGHTSTAHGRLIPTPVSSAILSAPAPPKAAAGRRSAGSTWADGRN